jgi:hypothetical protein
MRRQNLSCSKPDNMITTYSKTYICYRQLTPSAVNYDGKSDPNTEWPKISEPKEKYADESVNCFSGHSV